MTTYLVSVPALVIVNVEADSAGEVTEELVVQAILDEFGKYIELDARELATDRFEVIDDED